MASLITTISIPLKIRDSVYESCVRSVMLCGQLVMGGGDWGRALSLQQAEITGEVLTRRFSMSISVVYSASYPPGRANRVAAYQWYCCGVNTAEQKKLCLYTGSSFPICYINFKINLKN